MAGVIVRHEELTDVGQVAAPAALLGPRLDRPIDAAQPREHFLDGLAPLAGADGLAVIVQEAQVLLALAPQTPLAHRADGVENLQLDAPELRRPILLAARLERVRTNQRVQRLLHA